MPGAKFAEGRFRFAADVLLHEMVHQWHQEVTGQHDNNGYGGHGPAFRDKANEISEQMGLPRVRTCKERGKDRDLLSCSYWPGNTRPEGYYLGACITPSSCVHTSKDEADHAAELEKKVSALIKRYGLAEFREVAGRLMNGGTE